MKLNRLNLFLLGIVLGLIAGYAVGWVEFKKEFPQENLPKNNSNALINFIKAENDKLYFSADGNIRITWGNGQAINHQGDFPKKIYTLPWVQIPTTNDLKLESFLYTGNNKSKKFYKSSSYFARGVAIENRRGFNTRAEAIKAGFIPTKSLQ
jgi:lipopolysaccharide export system protein LptC